MSEARYSQQDGVGATSDGPVLTLKDDWDGTGIAMVHGEGESRQEWHDNTALPWSTFGMCLDNTVQNCTSNMVLNLHRVL